MSTISILSLSLTCVSWLAGVAPAKAQDAPSEEAYDFYRQNCVSCHTIGGGRLTGPDLQSLSERREEDWIVDFLLDPKAVIDAGDPYAVELLREARGVYMPAVPGLDRNLAQKLVRLIEAESAKERSEFAGLQISDRPLTAEDVTLGRELFRGTRSSTRGAPPCMACHTVRGLDWLGGGTLGPDLTDAYDRLEGRKSLAAWLSSPPSLVMQPVFKQHPLEGEEVLSLVAYLKDVAEREEEPASASVLEFLLAGFGGSMFLLFLFDYLWRKRYRATRGPLVRRQRRNPALGS